MNRYLKKHRLLFTATLVPYVLQGLVSVFLSLVLKTIVDAGTNQDMHLFYISVFLVVVFIILTLVVTLLQCILNAIFLKKVMIDLKGDLFRTLFLYDIKNFNEVNSSKYVSNFNNDLKLIEEKYFDNILDIILEFSLFICSLIAVVYLDHVLAIIIITINVASIFLPLIFAKAMGHKQTIYLQMQEKFNIKIKDYFNGFELIKSYNLTHIILAKFQKVLHESEEAMLRFRYVSGRVIALSNINSLGISVITSLISVLFVIHGDITLGTMMAIIQLVNSVANPISRLSKEIPILKSTKPTRKNIEDMLSYTPDKGIKKDIDEISKITVDHVSFSYHEHEPVLKDVSFVFEKGKKYAIVGESGSGKSTFLKMLLQFYTSYSGEIYFDDENVKNIHQESIYKQISSIHQNVYLFNDTIKNNICLYEEYDKAYLDKVIEDVQLTTVISGLENDIETVIDENGSNFSGGEKQRIAMA